jgi:ferric-dicitrate binding protein FerR (iron transport regulator)
MGLLFNIQATRKRPAAAKDKDNSISTESRVSRRRRRRLLASIGTGGACLLILVGEWSTSARGP